MTTDIKSHWESIYRDKLFTELSWYQQVPEVSLRFLKELDIHRDAAIIDIGGGESYFVDHLLELGYQNITVLDIAETAIERAKKRLGERARSVKWVVADVTTFVPPEQYTVWHDRAAFHFLTSKNAVDKYVEIVRKGIRPNGILVLGTFSESGPVKCSGLEIRQYSEASMTKLLKQFFQRIKCITVDHRTPGDAIQNFLFCSFRRLAVA